jgi:hypothetical protein
MEKNRDKPIWVIIHMYMEISQGNSLCSYLKQTKISFFFFYKIREQKGRMGSSWGLVPVLGEDVGRRT